MTARPLQVQSATRGTILLMLHSAQHVPVDALERPTLKVYIRVRMAKKRK